MYAELCERLDRAATSLTECVLAEMYQNPFWVERFGERAQIHGRKDGRFHIDYLVQALGADDPTIVENYARWLQQVLTTRGMCTRHLADNFDLLGAAIANEGWPDGAAAVRMLRVATAALRYPSGAAREVQDRIEVIATGAIDTMYARHPDWAQRSSVTLSNDNLAYHLHYAADALALGSSTTFLAYVDWITGFLERRQVPRMVMVESLETLRDAPGAGPELRDLLAEAVHSLST